MPLDPVDKINTDYLIDQLTRPSEDLDEKTEKIMTAFEGLDIFYSEPTDEKEKIPYQYKRESQVNFKKHSRVISYELKAVYRVVLNLQTKLYQLEQHDIQIPTQYLQQKAPDGQEVNIPQHVQQGQGLLTKFRSKFGGQPKNILDLESPYRLNLNIAEEAKQTIQFFFKMLNYHNSGVMRAYLMEDKEAMFVYLNDEMKYFGSNAEPKILPLIGESFQLEIDTVNDKIEKILTASLRVQEQHRLE